jgi:hypothetical protein
VLDTADIVREAMLQNTQVRSGSVLKSLVRSGFRLILAITFWILFRKAIDRRSGVAHNRHLTVFFLHKSFSFHSSAIMQGQEKERWKENEDSHS